MIHVYGFVQELDALPPLAGLDNAPLERRRLGGLELVVSRLKGLPAAEASQEAVLRHAQVVEELMSRSRAILPAQFGRAFGAEDELAAAVKTKAGELERGLSRVDGCVEFGLRVVGPGQARTTPAVSSGTEYMRTRLGETKRRDRLVDELHEPLARLARSTVLDRVGSRGLLEAAYLVPKASARAFRDAVARLEIAHPELTVVCTGPWPPYSFAAGREDEL